MEDLVPNSIHNGKECTSSLATIVETLDANALTSFLKKNSSNGTIIHKLMSTGEIAEVDAICQKLSGEAIVELLMVTTSGGRTAVHEAALKDQVIVLNCVLECLASDEAFKVLMMKDTGGATALHVAASRSYVKSVRSMLNYLTSEQRFNLLKVHDNRGEAVVDRFFKCSSETQKEIQDYYQAACVFVVNRSMNKEKR